MGSSKLKSLENLYMGARAGENADRIMKAVSGGKLFPGLYVITFASNSRDQLDIVQQRFLLRKNVRDRLPVIVGYAIGRQEAFETIAAIAGDAYRSTGGCDLQKYLLSIQKES